jgi:hypothetical protein
MLRFRTWSTHFVAILCRVVNESRSKGLWKIPLDNRVDALARFKIEGYTFLLMGKNVC